MFVDVHFVYYTSQYNTNLFKEFVLSVEDHLIRNSNIDDITQHLSISILINSVFNIFIVTIYKNTFLS